MIHAADSRGISLSENVGVHDHNGLEHPGVAVAGFAGGARFRKGRNVAIESDRAWDDGYEYIGPPLLAFKRGCRAM